MLCGGVSRTARRGHDLLVGVGSGGEDLGGGCDLLRITPYVIGAGCRSHAARSPSPLCMSVSSEPNDPFGRRLTGGLTVLISKNEVERSEFALRMNLSDKRPALSY